MVRNKYVSLLILFALFIIGIYFLSYEKPRPSPELHRKITDNLELKNSLSAKAISTSNSEIEADASIAKQLYKILLWTEFYDYPFKSDFHFSELKCQFSNCLLTVDKQQLNASDAVLFHYRNIDGRHLPSHHRSNQIWILFNWEPPFYSPIEKLYPVVNDIDWVMSYRQDSDVYAPYGRVVECASNWSLDSGLIEGKTRNIAWLVSNCKTMGRREDYVEELRKYIDVDVYGKCGQLKCMPKYGPECYKTLEKKYRFYLAFENSFCKDYVTEKLFFITQYNIIPIVYGAANYSQIMPKNSYIDANQYSPKQLAQYLQTLASDPNKYNSYFEWKTHFCSEPAADRKPPKYFCDICRSLNTASDTKSRFVVNNDVINWMYNKAQCLTRKKLILKI